MVLKEQNWTPYRKKAYSIELNIKDRDNQTIDFFRLYKDKTRDIKRILKKIKDTYDFNLIPKEVTKEKNWIKKDLEW